MLSIAAYFALRPGRGWLRSSQPKAVGGSDASASTNSLSAHVKAPNEPLQLELKRHSSHSLDSDLTLSFIASSLASARAAAVPARATAAPAGGGSGGGGAVGSSVRQWEVQWEEITPLRVVGRGSFGKVYLCCWNETEVACKVLLSEDNGCWRGLELPAATMASLEAEAAIMARMRHPNIVTFLGLCALPPCILTGALTLAAARSCYGWGVLLLLEGRAAAQDGCCCRSLCLPACSLLPPPCTPAALHPAEYCSRGSLYDVLRAASLDPAKAAQMTWRLRLSMVSACTCTAYLHPPALGRFADALPPAALPLPPAPPCTAQALDAAAGMLYLHRMKPATVHRDLKSPNLLIDEHYRIKVACRLQRGCAACCSACAASCCCRGAALASLGLQPHAGNFAPASASFCRSEISI